MNAALSSPASSSQVSGERASWGLLPDFGRQQLLMLTEIADTLFRSGEALRKIQQQAAHHASLQHQAVTKKLRTNCTPADLLDIQSALLHFDTAGARQYWHQVAAVAQQAQFEIINSTSRMPHNQAGNSLQSTLNSFQATLPLVNGFFASRPSCAIE